MDNFYMGAGMNGMSTNVNPYGENFVYNTSPFANRQTFGPIDQMLMMFAGNKLYPMPRMDSNQSVYDAYWRRQRDMELLRVRNNAVASNLFVQKLGGLRQDSMLFQMGAGLINNPDGPVAKFAAPLIGGNPIQAQMSMFANMRGLNMGTFGTTRDVTANDVNQLQNVLYGKFYNNREINQNDFINSQNVILSSAKRRGMSQSTIDRLSDMFHSNGTLDETRYSNFKNEAGAISGIEGVLSKADLSDASQAIKAKEAAETFLKNITDPTAKDKIKKAIADSIKEGNVETFRKLADTKSIDTAARQLEMHSAMKMGDKIPVNVNFANSYGFALEDITSAFSTAAGNRLLGNQKDMFSAMGKFADGNSMAALDAARSLFGNGKTGKELQNSLNEFLGVSSVDLTSTSQAGEVEDLLRRVKALGRNANISIDALLEIINQGKGVAANARGLQFMGGMEVGKMTVAAGTELSALSGVMDATSLRRMGGTQGLLTSLLGGKLDNGSQPISQQLAALHTYFKNNSQVQEEIRNYAKNGDLSQIGLNTFQNNLARKNGVNYYDLMSYATSNTMASNIGMADAPELADAGAKAQAQQFRLSLYMQNGGGLRGQAALDELDKGLSTRSVDLDEYLGAAGNDTNKANSELAAQIQSGLSSAGFNSAAELVNATPEVQRKNGKLLDKINQLQGSLDSRVTDRYDVAGNLISSGKDAFLEGSNLVNNNKRLQLDRLGTSQYLNVGTLNQEYEQFVRTGSYVPLMKERDAGYRKIFEAAKARDEEGVKMEKTVGKTLAFLNSPLSTQIFDQMLSGNVAKEGITSLLKPLGFGTDSQRMNQYVAAGERIVGITTAGSTDDLARALQEAGVKLSKTNLKELEDYSAKYGLTGASLKNLRGSKELGAAKSDAEKLAIAKKILNEGRSKDQQVGDAEAKRILKLSELTKGTALESYSGVFTKDNMREQFGKYEIDKFRDDIAKPELDRIDKMFADRLNSQKDGIHANADQQATAKALIDAKLTSVESLRGIAESTGLEQGKDGKQHLTKDFADLAKRLGININPDKEEEAANAIHRKISDVDFDKYMSQADTVKSAAKHAGEDDSTKLASISDKLTQIIDSMKGSDIAGAINKLASLTG